MLDEPTAVEKAKFFTILQREPERKKPETVSKTETKPEDMRTCSNHCLCSNPQRRKSQSRHWTKLPAATKFQLMMVKLRLMTEHPLWVQTPSFLHMTKSMCIAVQLSTFFFHYSQLHNERLLDKSQNPREIRTCSLPIARHKCWPLCHRDVIEQS